MALLLVMVTGLTGCGTDRRQVEVFSWWTGPGEAEGLRAMRAIFERKNPDLAFFDAAVAGGSGDKAKAVLQSKLQAKTPPDSFQSLAGEQLQGYVRAGQLESLNFLYDELKLRQVLPAQLVDRISADGQAYAVPVNIHRSNVLWFNPAVLKEAGVAGAPQTLAEFIVDLGKAKAKGVIPLAIGSEWTLVHLLENVLLGALGTDAYNALFVPGADWGSAAVTGALESFKSILSFAGPPQDDWEQPAKQVADGQAAFTVMGDWVYSYLHNPPDGGLGLTSHQNFDWAPAPGTKGTFLWISDSFTLPKGAKNREGAIAWLKVVGSKEAQDVFNPLKGSIPARKDADTSRYTDYLADSLKDWRQDRLAGSIQHGVSVDQPWLTSISEAVGLFQGDRDVAALQAALVGAAKANAR